MSDHRHSTDRVDGLYLAECPNGCATIELEYTDAADHSIVEAIKELAEECSHCDAAMDIINYEEPSEVLD